MARVPFIDPEQRPDLAPLAQRISGARRGRVINVYRALLNSPPLAETWFEHLNAVRWKTSLSGRLRELVIIRIGHLADVAYIIKHALDEEIRTMEVSPEAEQAWVETIVSLARNGEEFLESCTPGYYNNEGKPGEVGGKNASFIGRGQNGPYGGGSIAFVKILEDWRADGQLNGMELC